jgi:hypothetical protein
MTEIEMRASTRRVPAVAAWAGLFLAVTLAPAVAEDSGAAPVEATTEAGERVLLYSDGTWERVPETGVDNADAESGDDAPAALALGELIDRARDLRGDTIAVEGQIRCFSDTDCDMVSDADEFYTRQNVDVTIGDLVRDERLRLVDECGRFDARCPVVLVAVVDLNRYNALVLRAESIERQ